MLNPRRSALVAFLLSAFFALATGTTASAGGPDIPPLPTPAPEPAPAVVPKQSETVKPAAVAPAPAAPPAAFPVDCKKPTEAFRGISGAMAALNEHEIADVVAGLEELTACKEFDGQMAFMAHRYLALLYMRQGLFASAVEYAERSRLAAVEANLGPTVGNATNFELWLNRFAPVTFQWPAGATPRPIEIDYSQALQYLAAKNKELGNIVGLQENRHLAEGVLKEYLTAVDKRLAKPEATITVKLPLLAVGHYSVRSTGQQFVPMASRMQEIVVELQADRLLPSRDEFTVGWNMLGLNPINADYLVGGSGRSGLSFGYCRAVTQRLCIGGDFAYLWSVTGEWSVNSGGLADLAAADALQRSGKTWIFDARLQTHLGVTDWLSLDPRLTLGYMHANAWTHLGGSVETGLQPEFNVAMRGPLMGFASRFTFGNPGGLDPFVDLGLNWALLGNYNGTTPNPNSFVRLPQVMVGLEYRPSLKTRAVPAPTAPAPTAPAPK